MNTYSINGSDTTKSISRAPETVQTFWNLCNSYGVSIARVRKLEDRFESTEGKTFKGTHYGKVSLYEQLKKPEKPLWFKRLLGVDTTNPTMQILEGSCNRRNSFMATSNPYGSGLGGTLLTILTPSFSKN